MSEIVGYMITWTTYGSWLPGDQRGYVEDSIIHGGNYKTFERNKKRQKSPSVKLTAEQKKIVHQTILSDAEKNKHEIKALTVCPTHVHLVARPGTNDIETLAGRYKSITTSALWQQGLKGRVWSKGYDKRFCFTEQELAARINYVQKHD